MTRPLDAEAFVGIVKSRLASVMHQQGDGPEGRAGLALSFPNGIPRHKEQRLGAPQLVVAVKLKLSGEDAPHARACHAYAHVHTLSWVWRVLRLSDEDVPKDAKLLGSIKTHGEVIARTLGEATGVDSVDCRLTTRKEDEWQWMPDATRALQRHGPSHYVVFKPAEAGGAGAAGGRQRPDYV